MNNSKLIDKAQAIAACLSYNDDTNSGNPKEMIRELCHRLGSNTVRIHKKRDGYLMVNLFGSARYLTFMEGMLWRFLKLPPEGMTVEALAARRAKGVV